MAQWLRALTGLPVDPGLIPSTHMVPGDLAPSSDLRGKQTYRQNAHTHKKLRENIINSELYIQQSYSLLQVPTFIFEPGATSSRSFALRSGDVIYPSPSQWKARQGQIKMRLWPGAAHRRRGMHVIPAPRHAASYKWRTEGCCFFLPPRDFCLLSFSWNAILRRQQQFSFHLAAFLLVAK